MAVRRAGAVSILPLLLLLLPLPGAGQSSGDFPVITLGERVSGSLTPGGPALKDRGPFAVYRFDGQSGIRYSVEARSEDFDAYLVLARPVGGITEFLREDDDGGEGTDARLRFTLDETGPHLLVVQALRSGTAGSFTLSIDERELPPQQPPRPLSPGEAVQGRITDLSPLFFTEWDTEIPHDLWTFEGRGGDTYMISLESDDFDAYLDFGPLSGDELIVQQSDDDGGSGTHARMRVVLPHDGRFGVRARPLGEDGEGDYTLRVDPYTPMPAARTPIAPGQVTDGTLTFEDAMLDGGPFYQEWIYEGVTGERVAIRMRSDDFDSYLSLGREVGGNFVEHASNDDAPNDGLNSLIEVTLTENGPYVIRARALGSGQVGNYTLEVQRR